VGTAQRDVSKKQQQQQQQQRGGGLGVRTNRLSPFLPSRRTPLSERLEQANLCCVQLLTVRCGL